MSPKKFIAAVAAVSLATTPALAAGNASALSLQPAVTAEEGSSAMGGGAFWGYIVAAAVLVGFVFAAIDAGDEDTVGGPVSP